MLWPVCYRALAPCVQFIGELVRGQSLWSVLAIFCGLVLVGTTFISHTVGAMVILPIVQSVGDHMPGNHSKLLVMGAALMCSGGCYMEPCIQHQKVYQGCLIGSTDSVLH